MRSWLRVDTTQGEYLPVKVIIEREGGDKETELAAEKLVKKCYDLGEPWISYNMFTERWDAMYVRRSFAESLTQAWAH